MSAYDWELSPGAPLCLQSDSFYHAVRQGIVQQLRTSPGLTSEQWDAVFVLLKQLRDKYQQDVSPMHYGSLVGGHRCVRHLYREGKAILRGLQLTMPVQQPPPPPDPAPEPHEHSLEEVVDIFEATDELYLGDTAEGEGTS
jgi:hypothetical protein